MPPIRAVTFDCAETLLRVRWTPGRFALDCARAIGLSLDEQAAEELYLRLLGNRWTAYRELNATRDHDKCIGWWRELTADWLERIGHGEGVVERILDVSSELLYGPESDYFEVLPDVAPALEKLRQARIRIAVVSNWDYSLHRVLASRGLGSQFEFSLASLEEGLEKPDPGLFRIALDRFQLPADEVLHVGDNPEDDFRGAIGAGMRALLLDRTNGGGPPSVIRSLEDLPSRVLDWRD